MASAAASSLLVRSLRSSNSITSTASRLLVANRNNVRISAAAASPSNFRFSSSATDPVATAAPTAGQTLAEMASVAPHVEVIRYEHKNVKWTLAHVEYFADSLAVGMLETGLQPGDAILSWLPLHFSEQHILQFACSKAGFVLYHLDPELATTDSELAKTALKAALEITEATCLYTQEAGSGTNYVNLVKQVIPETRIFAFQDGMPFFTPRFPHLRFPIHTGFDQDGKAGFMLLKHMLVPSGELKTHLAGWEDQLNDATPLLGELVLDAQGIPTNTGKALSNKEVLEGKIWPQINSILNKEYSEVEGVGVIF